ncbi:AI-2E family transporter [Caballeronia sp. S22]|uniref:AI-2E family transporter n=1 Tax=Caballeronia sp. S22 TaxID=3137182 RepID=UPI0035306972
MTVYHRQSLFWGAVALAAGLLLWNLRAVLTPFVLGALVAYILQPGVEWLVRRRTPRGLAALAMICLFALSVALVMLLMCVVIEKEGPELVRQVPVIVAKIDGWLKPHLAALGVHSSLDVTNIRDVLAGRLKADEHGALLAVGRYLRTGSNVMINVVSNAVLMPLVLFYLLYDRHEAFARIEGFVPRRWVGKAREFVGEIDRMMSQYLRGQLLVIAVLAVFYPTVLMIAGLDMAVPVGLFSALAVFVPYMGFATGFVFALLAALLQFGDWYGLGIVIAVYGVGQMLESFVLMPRLVGERIGLHPLAVIFALLAFGRVFGFFGVLLALPVSAILASVLRELRRRYLASALYTS